MKRPVVVRLLRQAFTGWRVHNDSRLAAAIAYYTIFSLAPLLVIVLFLAGAVFGEAAAKGELAQQIGNLVGTDAVPVIEGMIEGAGHFRSGLFAWVVGGMSLLIGATGVFAALRDALAAIWDVRQEPGLRGIVRTRIISFLVILSIGVLLLALLITTTTLSVIVRMMGFFPGIYRLLDVLNFLLSFTVITCLFAFTYKILINAKLRWNEVWAGAALTSLLFTGGKLLIGLFLASSRMRSVYGAASSVIVMLFWIYFSAQVFLFGAEFIRACVNAGYSGSSFPWRRRAIARGE